MGYKEAIRQMHEASKVSYSDASRHMGRSPQYLTALLQSSGNTKLDVYVAIASSFGFRLVVCREDFTCTIKQDAKDLSEPDDVAALDAIRYITDSCPLSNETLSDRLAMPSSYLISMISNKTMPRIDTFISIAVACGNEVMACGHGTDIYLSKHTQTPATTRPKRPSRAQGSTGKARKNTPARESQASAKRITIQTTKKEGGEKSPSPFVSKANGKKTMPKNQEEPISDNRAMIEDDIAREYEAFIADPNHVSSKEETRDSSEQNPSTEKGPSRMTSTADSDWGFSRDTHSGADPQPTPQPTEQNAAKDPRPERSSLPAAHGEEKLNDYKKRLLDLSMRNNLLNYRDKKTGTIHALIPDATTIYRHLVINEKPMTFRESNPEENGQHGERAGSVIVTERTRSELTRSLRRLDTVARSSIEEQGINILYLAFGMLCWIDDAQKEHLAPLVMAPMRLSRASARSSYVLQTGDDEPVANPTLAYYLQQSFGIELPSFEKEDHLQTFLSSVAKLAQTRPGWSVTTDVVLSTFQFQKLSMYHDLEARSNAILLHPIVKAIMGDRSALGEVTKPKNPDQYKPTDTYQVVNADASQQEAILSAHRGESFVLQGPPGTGKSQTITNIIADCLGSGKKVLFVSEKKAALDVVHRRLTEAKLDDFCLVLHSNKAGKKDILGQLSKTLGLYGNKSRMSSSASTRLDTMARLRDDLNDYANEIYKPIEPLGSSPYEVIGTVANYERERVPWVSCRIEDIKSMTPSRIAEMTDAIRTYARELERLGEPPENNPWTTFGVADLEYGESGETVRVFSQVAKGARELFGLWDAETTELSLDVSPTFDAIEASLDILKDIAALPTIPIGISKMTASESRSLVEQWKASVTELEDSRDKLLTELSELGKMDSELDLHPEPSRVNEGGYAKELAHRLAERLDHIQHYAAWQKASPEDMDAVISRLESHVRAYNQHREAILADYHPELLDIDFVAMESRFKTEYQSLLKRVFGQHGEDLRTLSGLRRSASQVDDEEAMRILSLLHDLSDEERALDEMSDEFEASLGDCYRGMRTDFQLITHKREALLKARSCIELLDAHNDLANRSNETDERMAEVFEDIFTPANRTWTDHASDVIDALEKFLAKYSERKHGAGIGGVLPLLANVETSKVASDLSERISSALTRIRPSFERAKGWAAGTKLGERSLDQLARAIDSATDAGPSSLERSASYTRAKRLCSDLGMSGFIEAIADDKRALEPEFLDQYENIFLHTLNRIWLGSVALVERPALRDFSTREQERRISRFSELDSEQLQINRARVLNELFPRIPSTNVRTRGKDEISILLRELNKKSRIRPIRKLFADIPRAVLALKPCLMMSPLSVSTYLESANFQFDTVIFDEASQVRTEDALGVISRGKQVIIAGDSKQLPPTNFFAATVAEDDEVEDDEDYYEQAGSFDSVLDEAALLNSISLKWHYRSRDESLITFSNEEIYDGSLFTFPSSHASGRDAGVEYIYLPNGIYEGSRKGNAIEAERVADLVLAHFATYGTERSLGVITLGEGQQRVIENKLLDRRLAHPETERFFGENARESFFIKNLENVQGDERDTIILSVGYAKDSNGRLSHNFGPINMEGGERRLNVAVTRARVNLKLVTSLDPSEIDANRVSNVGPRLLRDYLSYAKVGPSGEGGNLQREYGYVDADAFEQVILDVLTDAGYEVDEHVGRSGCKVDLAIRHPEHRDDYCMGIICDGRSYHAATTARDRDRLRNQVLRDMGWHLYHVWSRAWLKDPKRQTDLLIEAVKDAVETFVPLEEQEVPEQKPEEPTPSQPSGTVAQETEASLQTAVEESEQDDEPLLEESEYLEIERDEDVEVHRYGFQDYPEYHPPRKGAISDTDLLRQFIYAQAPFSVDYFLQGYHDYCFPDSQKMTKSLRQSGIGYLQTKLRNMAVVRKEHGVEYVFVRDQRQLIPRVAGPRSIADISATELREGVLAVLRNYMGELDRKELIEETAAAFEFARRGKNIEQRIGEAIDDLRLYGKVKVIDGFYVPTNE